jgi:hypothetical protein
MPEIPALPVLGSPRPQATFRPIKHRSLDLAVQLDSNKQFFR